MHVCITIPSLSKTIGGPATVAQQLSDRLASAGIAVDLLTSELVSSDAETSPRNPAVRLTHVPAQGHGRWRRLSGVRFRKMLVGRLDQGSSNLVHDFGLWLPANHAVASACRGREVPLVCSPCGMLAPWALQHRPWKKRIAWWLYQHRDLRDASLLVATAPQEVQDIRRHVPGKAIALVPNGVHIPSVSTEDRPSSNGAHRAVFLGRLHPVKGLKNLVQAWDLVRPSGWRCVLAGPDEGGYQSELVESIKLAKLERVFEFPGLMQDDQKWELLRMADLFLLPSFTENFGIAAAEALACGLPVITTKRTPWQDLVAHRCGWWVDIGVQPLADALRQATSLSDAERRDMGRRGRQLAQHKYSWERIATDMIAAYSWLLGRGPKPGCVQEGANV